MSSIPTLFVPPILTACTNARLALIPSGDTGSLTRGPYTVLITPTPGTPLESISSPVNAQTALERIANLTPNSLTDWRVDLPVGVAVSFAVVDQNGEAVEIAGTGNPRMIHGSDQSCIGQNAGVNTAAFRNLELMVSSLSAAGSTIALPSSVNAPVPTSTGSTQPGMGTHLSTGCIIGVIIGCVLALLIAIGSALFFVSRRNKRQRDLEAAQQAKLGATETKTVVLPTLASEKEKEAEREWDDAASEKTVVQ